MRALGFVFHSAEFYVVTLEGTKSQPRFISSKRILFPKGLEVPNLTPWVEEQLNLLIADLRPTHIAYKLTAALPKHQQIFNIYFSLAILNLLAAKSKIAIKPVAPISIRPQALGLAKGTNWAQHINTVIGQHPPHWDSTAIEAAMIALMQLI